MAVMYSNGQSRPYLTMSSNEIYSSNGSNLKYFKVLDSNDPFKNPMGGLGPPIGCLKKTITAYYYFITAYYYHYYSLILHYYLLLQNET